MVRLVAWTVSKFVACVKDGYSVGSLLSVQKKKKERKIAICCYCIYSLSYSGHGDWFSKGRDIIVQHRVFGALSIRIEYVIVARGISRTSGTD